MLECNIIQVDNAIPLETNPSIYPQWISKGIIFPMIKDNVEYKYIKKSDVYSIGQIN